MVTAYIWEFGVKNLSVLLQTNHNLQLFVHLNVNNSN